MNFVITKGNKLDFVFWFYFLVPGACNLKFIHLRGNQ